ncbi:anti-sigma-K factor RskA [Microbacterium ginsengiterrae]|uniref:Regulator of SigK n=1 Tax=Microbacterium ginsengiterrae TaxID=546115 RepID=A0A7W9CAH6_9MICO|nr:anti-sigma factor [Microbacterium ginsengiterrae]MBB5742039.1 anti-sigma-K factor RskA [Microbacterium ginsengiterrae]
MNESEFAELAAGRALHALSDADERRFTDALLAHPEWAAIAEDDEATAAALAGVVTAEAPPVRIRAALLEQIASIPQGESSPPTEKPVARVDPAPRAEPAPAPQEQPAPAPRRRGRRLFALAASVALIAGLGIGAAVLIPQLTPPASVVALEQIESAPDAEQATVDLGAGAQATAHWSASVGRAVLVTEGLDPLEGDQTYQLWFVRGEDALPAGIFDTDAGAATALLDGAMRAGDVIAVTVEPAGGSPTGTPSSAPILAIPTA